jgi:hypothetical protein
MAVTSATLLESEGPTSWKLASSSYGEVQAAPAVQELRPLLRADPSVQTSTVIWERGARCQAMEGEGGGEGGVGKDVLSLGILLEEDRSRGEEGQVGHRVGGIGE